MKKKRKEPVRRIDLHAATLEQIDLELKARFMPVVMAVYRPDVGAFISVHGERTICLGLHMSLGLWLAGACKGI